MKKEIRKEEQGWWWNKKAKNEANFRVNGCRKVSLILYCIKIKYYKSGSHV